MIQTSPLPSNPAERFSADCSAGLPVGGAKGSGFMGVRPVLRVDNISKAFGGLRALSDFSVDLGERQIVGLIGPNGAGKTTVFNCLTGLTPIDSGSIVLDGVSIGHLPPHRIGRFGLSRTFQSVRLFRDLTVRENLQIAFHTKCHYGLVDAIIRSPRFIRQERELLRSAEEILGFLGFVKTLDVKAGSLGYADQRKLELARALAFAPRVVLLDEPTGGMNEGETLEMMDVFRKMRDEYGITFMMVEHIMGVIMSLCDQIVVLDQGHIIAKGDPDHIRTNQRVVDVYLGAEGVPGAEVGSDV